MISARASLVIPTYNASSTIETVLEKLRGLDLEIIVVDDASQDDTTEKVARILPSARLLRQQRRGGPGAARNQGAQEAKGEILLFLDSDVVTEPEILLAMVEALEARPDLCGLFGCYLAADRDHESPLSRFRNLLHRYFHLKQQAGRVFSFWSGLGALRREPFRASGGYATNLTALEDVELGKRLSDAGQHIWLEQRFQGRHLKQWTWKSMIYTDIVMRAAPWTLLGLQGRAPTGGLNLSPRFKAAPPLLALALLAWPCSNAWGWAFTGAYLLANLPIYHFMMRSAGWRIGVSSLIYLAVHHFCCGVGFVWGAAQYFTIPRSSDG